jgi:signal peptidase I
MATPTPPTPAPEPAPADTAHWAVEWAKSIGFAVVVWLLLRTFLFEAFRIPSPSMERTLLIGDFLFVNKAVYGAHVPFTEWHLPKFRDPERSDLVIFDSVEDGVTKVVKRVMGLAGDTIEMRDRVIYRNGVQLDEPYAQYVEGEPADPPIRRDQIRRWQSPHLVGRDTAGYWPDRNNWGPVVIPEGHLFVMGDNRELSWDGRFWGFLPRQNIRGTPLFIYYTFDGDTYKPLPFLTNIRWGRFFTVPR